MKTLSIQQPWASLVCAGIKDVSHCAWHSVMALCDDLCRKHTPSYAAEALMSSQNVTRRTSIFLSELCFTNRQKCLVYKKMEICAIKGTCD